MRPLVLELSRDTLLCRGGGVCVCEIYIYIPRRRTVYDIVVGSYLFCRLESGEGQLQIPQKVDESGVFLLITFIQYNMHQRRNKQVR